MYEVEGRLEIAPITLGDLVLVLVEVLADPEHQGLELVLRVDGLAARLVLGLVVLRLLDHALDVRLGHSGGRGDGDVLRLAGGLVLG